MHRQASDDETIPFITLPNWIKAAAQCGFNIQPIFEALGIDTDLLHVESATIARDQLQQLMARCVDAAEGDHFPFVLGDTFGFEYLPDLETFLTTSPSLREAARVFDWVRLLINPMLDVTLRESGEDARLLMLTEGDAPPRIWFIEATFATVQKFLRLLIGTLPHGTMLDFRHAAPPHATAYERFFDMPARFGQAEDALHFRRAFLDAPLPGGYPTLHEQAHTRIAQRLHALPRSPGVAASIERALRRRPALFGLGVEATAEELGLHPRTLQRRLQAAGTHFAALQAEARHKLARQYLTESTLDIDHISERLGYSDRRSFTRAFQRWTGMTPSAFRAHGDAPETP